jgi:pimeloyl-ACP methyl ester carboxylesterase
VSVGAGSAVVLLHGWPGFWFDYRHVLPRVATLGHAVAPDFLGFGASDAVHGDPVEAAGEEAFAADVLELLDWLALDRVVMVGHDIGSAVAPALARGAPERVQGLVLLNPTHPYIGGKRYSPDAQRESWYQHFHRLPLAEGLIDGDRRRVELYLSYFYEHWAGRDRIRPSELATVVDVYARPGAFAASLLWYRASRAAKSATGPRCRRTPDHRTLGGSRPDATTRPPGGIRESVPTLDEPSPHGCRALRRRRSARRRCRSDRGAAVRPKRSSGRRSAALGFSSAVLGHQPGSPRHGET